MRGLQAMPINPYRAAAVDGANTDTDILQAHIANDGAIAVRYRHVTSYRCFQDI